MSRTLAITEALKASNGGKPVPHLVIVEEDGEGGGGVHATASVQGDATKVIGLFSALAMNVAEALKGTRYSALSDPENLLDNVKRLLADNKTKNMIQDEGEEELQ